MKEMIRQHLSRIPMIFSDNAIMLNALGAWKNANRYKNANLDESVLDLVAVTKE